MPAILARLAEALPPRWLLEQQLHHLCADCLWVDSNQGLPAV